MKCLPTHSSYASSHAFRKSGYNVLESLESQIGTLSLSSELRSCKQNPRKGAQEDFINAHTNLYIFQQLYMWVKVKMKCSVLSDSATSWTVAHQASPSMGFSRQEYWSRLPFPSPGDLPDPGIEPRSPALQANALTSEPPGKPYMWVVHFIY